MRDTFDDYFLGDGLVDDARRAVAAAVDEARAAGLRVDEAISVRPAGIAAAEEPLEAVGQDPSGRRLP